MSDQNCTCDEDHGNFDPERLAEGYALMMEALSVARKLDYRDAIPIHVSEFASVVVETELPDVVKTAISDKMEPSEVFRYLGKMMFEFGFCAGSRTSEYHGTEQVEPNPGHLDAIRETNKLVSEIIEQVDSVEDAEAKINEPEFGERLIKILRDRGVEIPDDAKVEFRAVDGHAGVSITSTNTDTDTEKSDPGPQTGMYL